MQLNTRKMQIRDASSVNRLTVQLGYTLSVAETAKQIEQISASAGHLALVAIEDDTILGWIHAFKSLHIESLPFVEVGGLVVDENFRGQGIGKTLLEHIKIWGLQEGVFHIRLRSQTRRLDAHQFYRACGFEEIKEQKVFQLFLEN